MKCSQKDCTEEPTFRYTWPGKDEAFVCVPHAGQMTGVARAIGLHLQLIPLTADDYLRAHSEAPDAL